MALRREQDLGLRYYWSVISRNKWAILGFAGASSLLATLLVFSMTPLYTASVTILIESRQPNVVSIEEVYGLDTRNQQYFATQAKILQSRPLVEHVFENLGLIEYEEFSPGDQSLWLKSGWLAWLPTSESGKDSTDPLEKAIETYFNKLAIQPIRDTQLVTLHFESRDPELAALVANSHAHAYIRSMLEARSEVTDSAATWMLERLDGLHGKLLASEQRLQEFREREQLIDVEGLQSLPAREIKELTSRLVEVRGELSQARIAYMQVFEQHNAPLEDLGGIPAILSDRGVQELQQAESRAQRRVAEIAERYGPNHPKMVSAQSELSKATENLRSQRRSVAEAIKIRYEAARAEEAELVAALNRAKQDYQEIGRSESSLLALKREVDTNRKLYDLFYNRISETAATGDLQAASARVISPAVVPVKPTKPKKKRLVALVFAFTFMAGVTAAFVREAVNNTIRSAADVEEKLRLPLLGMLPLLNGRRGRRGVPGGLYSIKSEPGFSEAIRSVRTAISLDNREHPHKVIVIASSISDEGKSTVALNLAHSFAKSEHVLLLEADMRRPSIGRALKLPDGRPGLSELLAEEATLDDCVYRGGRAHMDVLLSGSVPADPSLLLSSRRLVNALLVLRKHYDRVIVDSPPVLPVSDSLVLSAHADTVIFVAQSDSTPVRQINQALDLLLRVNARVTGVVVNKLDTRKAAKYIDYGFGGYFEDQGSLSKA